jgi:antitoxin MazE
MVRIGNSRGIRIPKLLIEQCNLGDTVDLRVENNCLIISPDRKPRQGWGDAFQASGPDSLILEGMPANRFDRDEWEW